MAVLAGMRVQDFAQHRSIHPRTEPHSIGWAGGWRSLRISVYDDSIMNEGWGGKMAVRHGLGGFKTRKPDGDLSNAATRLIELSALAPGLEAHVFTFVSCVME